jgi:L-malate glycosyltransferase
MKVLHITHWFPNQRYPHSGSFIANYVHAIHAGQPENGGLLFVNLLLSKGLLPIMQYEEKCDEKGLRVFEIRLQWVLNPLLYVYPQLQWLIFRKSIMKVVAGFSPDLIHGHVVHPSGALAMKICTVTKKPFVLTEHWSNIRSYLSRKLSSLWGLRAYRKAAFILPVSQFLQELVLTSVKGIDQQKVSVVPNVVAPDLFYYAPSNEQSDKTRFVMVSTWVRHKQITKRPELAMEALSRFSKSYGIHVSLVVIGDGSLLAYLKALAIQLELDVEFTGILSPPAIAERLRNSDFFLHASEIETFSLVTAEAMMCGLPAVVSNVGALPELVTASRGVTCNNTIEDWVAALELITSNSYNRRKISADISSLCSPDAISSAIQEVYLKAVADRGVQ